jgi:hypothetical protein
VSDAHEGEKLSCLGNGVALGAPCPPAAEKNAEEAAENLGVEAG